MGGTLSETQCCLGERHEVDACRPLLIVIEGSAKRVLYWQSSVAAAHIHKAEAQCWPRKN